MQLKSIKIGLILVSLTASASNSFASVKDGQPQLSEISAQKRDKLIACNPETFFSNSAETICFTGKRADGSALMATLLYYKQQLASLGFESVEKSNRSNLPLNAFGDEEDYGKNYLRNPNTQDCQYEVAISVIQPEYPKEYFVTIEAYQVNCKPS